MSRADADPRNVLHEDDPSILVAGSSLISRSSSLWKGQVTVGTVSRAYAEAERRGLVRGRVGSGTFVREPAVEEQSQAFGSPEWPATSEIDLSLNLPALPDRLEEDEALRHRRRARSGCSGGRLAAGRPASHASRIGT